MCAQLEPGREWNHMFAREPFMSGAHAVEEQPHAEDPMHSPLDLEPETAPLHHDIRQSFSWGQMAYVWILGAIAVVGGIVLGLTAVNN
jgi:hypothetical protein